MPQTRRKFPIVKVTWLDACSNGSGWLEPEDFNQWLEEPALMTSVGLLVARNKQWLALAMSAGDNCIADCLKIPLGMVKHVEQLGSVEAAWGEKKK